MRLSRFGSAVAPVLASLLLSAALAAADQPKFVNAHVETRGVRRLARRHGKVGERRGIFAALDGLRRADDSTARRRKPLDVLRRPLQRTNELRSVLARGITRHQHQHQRQ